MITPEQRRYAISILATGLVIFGGMYVAAILLTIGWTR